MGRKLLAGFTVAVALAGCGAAAKTVTHTTTVVQSQTITTTRTVNHAAPARVRTVTVTNTVTAPASSASPVSSSGGGGGGGGYASTYPIAFESSFDQSCIGAGGSATGCACALKQVESTVSYSTFAAAAHDIFTGNPPSWYTDAATSCAGQ
jgi:hypothetical protein